MRDRQVTTYLETTDRFTTGSLSFGKPVNFVSLSSVLESGPHLARYCLSPKACRGILRRAEKRGVPLPAPLALALAEASGLRTRSTDISPDVSHRAKEADGT